MSIDNGNDVSRGNDSFRTDDSMNDYSRTEEVKAAAAEEATRMTVITEDPDAESRITEAPPKTEPPVIKEPPKVVIQ